MLKELLIGNISQDEYFVIYYIKLLRRNLPKKIYGFVFNYKIYNYIVINNSISQEKVKKTLLHEMAHVELKHLAKRKKIMEFRIEGLEDEADEYIKRIKEEIEYE